MLSSRGRSRCLEEGIFELADIHEGGRELCAMQASHVLLSREVRASCPNSVQLTPVEFAGVAQSHAYQVEMFDSIRISGLLRATMDRGPKPRPKQFSA